MAGGKTVAVWVLAVLALLVVADQVLFAVRVMRSDPVYFSLQRQVVYWSEPGYAPAREQVAAVHATFLPAVQSWPRNGDYQALLARLNLWQALLAPNRAEANRYLDSAVAGMAASLRYRPANPYAWLQYAEYLAATRDDPETLELAIRKVQELGPGDDGLQAKAQALRPR